MLGSQLEIHLSSTGHPRALVKCLLTKNPTQLHGSHRLHFQKTRLIERLWKIILVKVELEFVTSPGIVFLFLIIILYSIYCGRSQSVAAFPPTCFMCLKKHRKMCWKGENLGNKSAKLINIIKYKTSNESAVRRRLSVHTFNLSCLWELYFVSSN